MRELKHMPYMNSNFLGLTKRKAKHVKGHEVLELAAATAILSYYVLDKHRTSSTAPIYSRACLPATYQLSCQLV